MNNCVVRLCVAIWLTIGAYTGSAQAETSLPQPVQTVSSGDDTTTLTFPDISKIDPRLAYLGAGVLAGLVIASPGLELSEVLGIALGVIGSQYLYYSVAPRPAGTLRPDH